MLRAVCWKEYSMAERRVIKQGNSLGITLPPEMLQQLNLRQGSSVRVELDEEQGGILVTPVEQPVAGIDAAFAERVDRFIERYRPALESLAKR